jgi:glycosyltransferase involved in cell wall biosynthesis
LKVLHISEYGLPEWFIEKSAITAKRKGYYVYFVGAQKKTDYSNVIFDKIYEIKWDIKAKYKFPFYYHILKRKISKVIEEVRPDIVHAHNILPAKIASEFDIPFVYDDHEYSSMYGRIVHETFEILESQAKSTSNKIRWFIKKNIKAYMSNLWTEWEKEIVSKYPTITVSDKSAEGLRKYNSNNKIVVVPNFPMKNEVHHLTAPAYHQEMSSVYMGRDGFTDYHYPHRNLEGLIEPFKNNDIGRLDIIGWEDKKSENSKIKFHGYLSRQDAFKILLKSSIGLMPWKKHWSHFYMNPNKAYDYAYAGLLVLCTSDLETIYSTLGGHCVLFDDYLDLVDKLKYFYENTEELNKLRFKSYNYAKDNIYWEKYDHKIIDVYNSLA